MKKLILLVVLFSVFLNTSFAGELPIAPALVLKEAIDSCKEWAQEDEVAEPEMYNYVLSCVNEELTDKQFQTVSKIEL
ncbi:MAG: hypothetical protein ACI9LM_002422 [Alteromonadaceae bacterium]|jgi:hypothetical protein